MMNTVAQRENHHSHPQESGSCFNDGFTPYPSQTQQQQSRSQQPRSQQQQQQSQSAAPQATLTAAHQSILSQLYQVNSSNPVYAPSIATPYPLFIDIHTGATIRLSEMAPSRPAAGARSEEGSATQQQQQTGGEGAGAVPEQFRYTGPQRSRTETALFHQHQQQQQNNAAGLSPAAMAWQPMQQQQQPSITVGARRVPMPIHNNNNTTTASTPHHTAQSLSSFTVGGAHASYPSSTPPSSTNSTQQQVEPATVAKPTIAASLEQLQQSTSPTTTNSNNMTTPSRPTKRPTTTSTVEPSEADTQTPARRTMAKGNNNSPATTQAKHAGAATTATTPSTTATTTATASAPNGPTYHYELVGRYRRFVATGTASFDEGTPVILEGDRGVDLAIVRSCSRRTHALMPRNYHTQGPKAIPAVLQAATSDDVARWEALRSDELDALEECQRCIAFNGMQNEMTVVNAVFQFDKQKLTFFYQTRAPRVDFRKLLNELFTKFRCRIWMEKDEEDQ
jgi:hypothetical protein